MGPSIPKFDEDKTNSPPKSPASLPTKAPEGADAVEIKYIRSKRRQPQPPPAGFFEGNPEYASSAVQASSEVFLSSDSDRGEDIDKLDRDFQPKSSRTKSGEKLSSTNGAVYVLLERRREGGVFGRQLHQQLAGSTPHGAQGEPMDVLDGTAGVARIIR